VIDPIIDLIKQPFHCRRAVISSDGFVESPPDPFDGIGGGGAGRQEVQFHAMRPARQITVYTSMISEGVGGPTK
jgi:hypothetical protein